MTMTAAKKDEHGFRFREWDIYNDARGFRNRLAPMLESFPKSEIYSLTDQTKRALSPVILNIAEGANKNTDKDTGLYINRALCSLNEVVACLDCAVDSKYIISHQRDDILPLAASLAKRLMGFIKHLNGK